MRLAGLERYDVERIEAVVRALPGELGAKPKAVFAALRLGMSGQSVTPGPLRVALGPRPQRGGRQAGRRRGVDLTAPRRHRPASESVSSAAPRPRIDRPLPCGALRRDEPQAEREPRHTDGGKRERPAAGDVGGKVVAAGRRA